MHKGLDEITYSELVKIVVNVILNDGEELENIDRDKWNFDRITGIDDGDYQGTILWLIPRRTYQPSEYEYLITFVNYGSCSGCDTLLDIQSNIPFDGTKPDSVINEFMQLCKDLVCNMKRPYNCGWREDEEFKEVEFN